MARRTQDARSAFLITVFYDNPVAARRGMNIFRLLDQALGEQIEFDCNMWRFDLLELAQAREVARAACAAADMIIVSTQSDDELPASVQSWLRSCLDQKRGATAAVVAFDRERSPYALPGPRLQWLQQAAQEAGLQFFTPSIPLEVFADADLPKIEMKLVPGEGGVSSLLHHRQIHEMLLPAVPRALSPAIA
jgi:hypothetical protein